MKEEGKLPLPTIGEYYNVRTVVGSAFVGKYIGDDYLGRHLFDLRPDHGTTPVAREDIKVLTRRV